MLPTIGPIILWYQSESLKQKLDNSESGAKFLYTDLVKLNNNFSLR